MLCFLETLLCRSDDWLPKVGFKTGVILYYEVTVKNYREITPGLRASAVLLYHCDILGFYLQQPHKHHVSRPHFDAEPHSQAEANTYQGIFCPISRSKLTDSVRSDNPSVTYSASLPNAGFVGIGATICTHKDI